MFVCCGWLEDQSWCIYSLFNMFQGKENKVILLSLVRSNSEQKIGFFALKNRICVAISRAKCALYMFGNSSVYLTSQNWKVRLYITFFLVFINYVTSRCNIQLIQRKIA